MSEVQPEPSDVEESVRKAVGDTVVRWGLELPDQLIGTRIDDRYTVVERIARGGMGTVFKAIQAPMGRVCAVKVLSASYDGRKDPAFDKRFRREAATISRLRHPNTVTLYDYGNIGDLYYMAMEYVHGRTLHAEISGEGPFGEAKSSGIAMQICRSLREAHEHGVVHRDLKPDNVLLIDRPEERDFVKLLDFGLAKVIEGDLFDENDVTETGLCMGSPKHMAPEQITGDVVSAHTDIYAVGILLYEMLTAHSPFDRPTRYQTLVAQLHEPPAPFDQVVPELAISKKMANIVWRCLKKERHRRFSSMNELLQAIKEADAEQRGLAFVPITSIVSTATPAIKDATSALTNPTKLAKPRKPNPRVNELQGSRPSLYPPPSNSTRPPSDNLVLEPRAISHASLPQIPPLPAFEPTSDQRTPRVARIGVGVGIAGFLIVLGVWQHGESSRQPLEAASSLGGLSSVSLLSAAASSYPKQAPKVRVLRLKSVPTGATVMEGTDVVCAKTPCEVRWSQADTERVHHLRFFRPGYVAVKHQVGTKTADVRVRLVPVDPQPPVPKPVPTDLADLADETGYKSSPY